MHDDSKQVSKRSTFDVFKSISLTPGQRRSRVHRLSGRKRMRNLYKCHLPSYRMFCHVFYQKQDKQKKIYQYKEDIVGGTLQKRKSLTTSVSFQNEIEYGQRKPNNLKYYHNLSPQKRSRKSAVHVRF